jgi:hypothetical protein
MIYPEHQFFESLSRFLQVQASIIFSIRVISLSLTSANSHHLAASLRLKKVFRIVHNKMLDCPPMIIIERERKVKRKGVHKIEPGCEALFTEGSKGNLLSQPRETLPILKGTPSSRSLEQNAVDGCKLLSRE